MRAVLLLSGGLDSYTAGAIARAEGYELFALTVRYGQVHAREVEAARDVARDLGVRRHLELDVPLAAFGGSALVGDGPVPKDRALEEGGIPSTYVPARNTIFLSLALAWAEVVEAEAIVIGVNALDYSGYPDCRPEYLDAFERLASLATRAGVEGRPLRILAPLLRMSKAEIIRAGIGLGLDYAVTHSCYDPDPRGQACGRCDSCRLRARGFAEAGLADPAAISHELLQRQFPVTDRLYYTDAYLTEFDAQVLRVDVLDGRPAAVLDRTAFYPTSGGQPFDVGTIADARVVDVVDGDDGTIRHVVEGSLAAGPVQGRIDWSRRFDHMQQHTGQHVLSASFDKLAQARTESFHLGSTASTIDLGREVSPAVVARVEEEANRIVWEDRPVHIRFADAAEAAALPLRKEPGRTGRLRLIDVEGCDLSACGGTHVARTGAIGVIAVTGWEKFRGGTRVEFVCGGRALRSHRALREVVTGSVRVLSVLPAGLPDAIERLQGELKDARKTIKGLQGDLAVQEGMRLADGAESLGALHVAVAALDGWDPGTLKTIASSIVERAGYIAVLFGPPAPAALVVARSADVALDSAAVLKRVTERFGGKGGGRPELAQGGGVTGSIGEAIEFAKRTIQELCAPS